MLFASPYPENAYLLRTERRLRYRDEAGQVDLAAARLAVSLLPHAKGLTPDQRERFGRVLGRIEKAAVAYGDLAADGLLDERYGFPVILEVPFNGMRRGTGPDGPWEKVLAGACYGFLPDTVARDEEPLDVIGGPDPGAPMVFIVAQIRPGVPDIIGRDQGTAFGSATSAPPEDIDEYKLMVGFTNAPAAEACYLENWPPELYGGMAAMPTEVLRGLLGFELGEAGTVKKALRAVAQGGLVAVMKTGAIFARVDLVSKGPITVSTFDAGGALLPMQGKPQLRRRDLIGRAECAFSRLQKALGSAIDWRGEAIPIATRPDLAEHPALTAPLAWVYDNPIEVGGWIGAVEPDDESWIAFIAVDGRALLWERREEDGGVIGAPVVFSRPDLVTARAVAPPPVPTFKAEVRLLPVEKGLDEAAPVGKRIVYGVVLEPEPFEGAGDGHSETYSAEVIEKAAHDYLAHFAAFDDAHGRFLRKDEIVPVESFVAPCDFMVGGSPIRKSSWVLAARILHDGLWARVLRGELKAWSIEGFAERVPNV